MTASFSGAAAVTASMDVPQTQNTAPVLEFRCLYTQDIRRKQKRWQDGRLKFHTFNKRVMVYDERSNFVGDTHWREDTEFGEGEELELERSGALVEVGECVGKRDQDLTELVDKRIKQRGERAAVKAASPAPSMFKNQGAPTPSILRQKPLNSLMTPTGHYGRALIPGTSPFEERQGLVGVQEKGEQDRPAKRRKPNELTSSKNGYAQNLMGATLNLASSRPPSTGGIRYEPLRVTSSVPVRSEHIDLTLEGSDDSDEGGHRTKEVKMTAKPSKLQKKLRRSPPVKSGYASNLTGVALTLSRPDSFGQNRTTKVPVSQPVVAKATHNLESSSEDEDSDDRKAPASKIPSTHSKKVAKEMQILESSSEDENINHQRASLNRLQAQSQKVKKVSRPQQLSALSLLSSSPPPARKEKASVPGEVTRPLKSVNQNSSAVEPAIERPTSALRIKPRAGPRMMMLMDRPSSRMNPTAESSGTRRTKSTPIQQPQKPSNDIVLSQATMELNSFCQKQAERLQARLKGERRTMIMDLDDSTSSPIDDGIDHQTIDRLLFRRSRPAEKEARSCSDLDITKNVPVEKQLDPQEQRGNKKTPTLSSNVSSPLNTSGTLKDIPPPNMPVENYSRNENLQLGYEEQGMNEKLPISNSDASSPLNASDMPRDVPPQVVRTWSDDDSAVSFTDANKNSRAHSLSAGAPDHEEGIALHSSLAPESGLSPTAIPQSVQAVGNRLRSGNLKRPKPPPQQMVGDIQAAKEHFRTIIKSSASPQHGFADLPLALPIIERRVEVQHLPHGNQETVPREVPLKTFSELLQPPEDVTSQPEPSDNDAPENDTATPVISTVQTMAPPRRHLVNPATRGKSVQTLAANTIDVLHNPTPTTMAPPPPRLATRTETVNSRNDVTKGPERGAAAATKEALEGGPWSREAFDLFDTKTCDKVMALRGKAINAAPG